MTPADAITERKRMEALRESALKKASALVEKKGKDYGHWSDYPLVALAALNYVKAKRMLELTTQLTVNPFAAAVNEPLEDSCLDDINYASFLHAKLMDMKPVDDGRRPTEEEEVPLG